MKRRELLTLLGSATAAQLIRAVARAQEAGRSYRLGIIFGGSREAPGIAAFFDELKLFGFVEGKNLDVLPSGFNLREDQYAEYARTLAKSNPDVIFCVGDAAALAAREATQTIPVVGFLSPNMLAAGVIRTFARPGGNVTGVSILAELDGKRQELLMEVVPSAQKIAILADPAFTYPAQLQVLEDAARAHGVEALILTAGKQAEIAPAMDKAKARGLLHSTCCRHHYSLSIAVSSSSGPRPTLACDPRMAGNGRTGRSYRLWPAPSADVSAGGTSGCKGLDRR